MSLLQELLDLGLVDIGGEDTRFAKVQSAASAFAARLKEEPALLIPSTLVALDNEVNEDDQIFTIVENLVKAEWKTLRNTHVNRPRELLRSIIIEALASAISVGPETAGVVWNTAVGPLTHGQARLGKSKTLVEKLFLQARDTAETEAINRAGLAPAPSPKRIRKKSENPSLTIAGNVNDEELLRVVARAVGPQYSGQNLEAPNPNWPNNQGAVNWANEFTPRMTDALVKAVNLGTSRLAESIVTQLGNYLGGFEKQIAEQLREFEQIQNEIARNHDASQMRLNVLWWSEALYSPLLKTGYRELTLPITAVVAAVDLSFLVPELAPACVRHILGEMVSRLSYALDDCGKHPVCEYLDTLTSSRVDLGETLQGSTSDNTRIPLITIVGDAAAGGRVSSDALRSRTGVDNGLELTAAEFAMWVFSDLQARRLIEVIQ